MSRKLLWSLSLLLVAQLSGCKSLVIDDLSPYPTGEEEQNLFITSHIYMTDEGYSLELNDKDALLNGIELTTLTDARNKVSEANKFLFDYLNSISANDSIYLLIPQSHIKGLPDKRLIPCTEDSTTTVRTSAHPKVDYVCKGGFRVTTTINGSPARGSGPMPPGTTEIRFSAGTTCLGGGYGGVIIASGVTKRFAGGFFNPTSGSFSPGMDEGNCSATIYSTGCDAFVSVCFWVPEGN